MLNNLASIELTGNGSKFCIGPSWRYGTCKVFFRLLKVFHKNPKKKNSVKPLLLKWENSGQRQIYSSPGRLYDRARKRGISLTLSELALHPFAITEMGCSVPNIPPAALAFTSYSFPLLPLPPDSQGLISCVYSSRYEQVGTLFSKQNDPSMRCKFVGPQQIKPKVTQTLEILNIQFTAVLVGFWMWH